MRKPMIAGNWKMNKTHAEAVALASSLKDSLADLKNIDLVVAPVFTALTSVASIVADSNIQMAAQNCYPADNGAYTGEISPLQLTDIGCSYCLVGHSERRQLFAETDAFINQKMKTLLATGVLPILCIGETLEERESGKMFDILKEQIVVALENIEPQQAFEVVIAYEPVWAIGTGKTATSAQAEEVHLFIRDILCTLYGKTVSQQIRILYGGSVKPDNVDELMAQPNIDGALVGGASLKVEDFSRIAHFK